MVRAGLELGISGFQVRHPNHSATLPSLENRGRGLISVEDCVNQAKILLEFYVQSSEEELSKAVRREGKENRETAAGFKARRRTKNIQEWNEKLLPYMDSLHERAKNREARKPGLG